MQQVFDLIQYDQTLAKVLGTWGLGLVLLSIFSIALARHKWVRLVRTGGIVLAILATAILWNQTMQAANSWKFMPPIFWNLRTMNVLAIIALGCVVPLGAIGLTWGATTENNLRTIKRLFKSGSLIAPEKEVIAGPEFEDQTGRKLAKHWLHPTNAPRPVSLGLVPFPSEDAETRHVLIEGSTGGGKSQAIKTLMATALERGDSVFVIDENCDMYNAFKDRAGTATRFDLLNGHDLGWWPVNEIERETDWELLAQSIYGDGHGSGEEWTIMAKSLFSAIMAGYQKACVEEDRPFSMKEAFMLLTAAPPEEIAPFIEGTTAATLGDDEKGLRNIRLSNLKALKFMQYLPEERGAFSIRQWMRDAMSSPDQVGLFVTYSEAEIETLKTKLSATVELAVKTAISVGENGKRVWLIIDELSGLGEIASLPNATAKLRKSGVRVVVGLQGYSQIEALYGRERAKSIVNNLSNKMYFATEEPDTAERQSRTLGEQTVLVRTENEGRSTKGNGWETKGKSRNWNMDEKQQPVVRASAFMSLPPLQAFVKMQGTSKVIKTKVAVYGGRPEEFKDKTRDLIEKGEPVFVAQARSE